MDRKSFKPLLLVAAALLMGGVFLIQRQLNRQRADPKLGWTRIAPLQNAPPVLAFTTVALGGFRGLIANALWIRANDLQQDGKYFEQVQLSDWITKLQPTLVQVWLVQAWNMAYNISVKFSDPADRWRWVQRGIELLRDDGIRYNPKEAQIYRELGWFFQHKMGQNMDDAHMYYKEAWLQEMTRVFGGSRPNFEELIHPQTEAAHQRARTLRDKYKMDPQRMKQVDELYGPLEWRLPDAHAIYWAALGLEKSNRKELITLRRVIYQSMQQAAIRGRVVAVRADGRIRLGPNLEIIPRASSAFEQMLAEDDEKPWAIKTAHRNFLKQAVYFLYVNRRESDAARWFNYLRKTYPDAVPADVSLEEYAFSRVSEVVAENDVNRTIIIIEGFLENYFVELVEGDEDRAQNFKLLAEKVWKQFRAKTRERQEAIGMPPFSEIQQAVLDDVLDPRTGLAPEAAAILRTRLNLPAAGNTAPETKS